MTSEEAPQDVLRPLLQLAEEMRKCAREFSSLDQASATSVLIHWFNVELTRREYVVAGQLASMDSTS